ncbi:class C sortase [Enterococcus sp. AZ072]|uniref:class C sortase n=1 Tax=unclassified Enterococcus TaxID=2608891 RepID=UPI003D277972
MKEGTSVKREKNKRRNSLLKNFALLMIFGGILTLLYPIVGNYLANRERSQAVSQYDDTMRKMSKADKEKQLQLAQEYNHYIFNKQEGKTTGEPIVYNSIMKQGDVMGTIDIPAIDIKQMPFYHGTSFKTLDKGLGHFEPTSIPIGGKDTRAVITGHSGVRNQVLFTDIRNLKEGDLFFINILGKRLAYEIDSFEEILPTDADKIKIQPKKDKVTLLTCTPPGINTFRLLVTGHRVDYNEAMQRKVKQRNQWSYQNIVLATLGSNVAIFLLLMGIYQYNIRRFRSDDPLVARKARKRLKRLFLVTKTLFILLFISMVAVMCTAIYGYLQMEQEPAYASVNIGQSEELSSFNLDKISQATYEEKQIASVKISDYAKAKSAIQTTTNNWGVGKIVIPKVSIDLPILAGLANENLLSGAATYRLDQQLGRGNYVLLAHNIFDKDVLLHRIQNLKKGDLIYTTDFKDIYVYEVSINKIIEETEVDYVEKNPANNRALLTLLRCEGDIGTIYRRLVQGNLKSILPLREAEAELFDQMNLTRSNTKVNGEIMKEDPITTTDHWSMTLAAKIISDPLQTVVPLFLLFLLPILFFSLI